MLELTRRTLMGAIAVTAVVFATPVLAEDEGHPYFGPDALDLTVLLAPPPAQDSEITKAELAEVKALQASVSEDRKKQAIADDDEGFTPFIATTSLASLDPAKVPLTAALIQRVLDTEDVVTKPAKKFFARPRPPKVDDGVKPHRSCAA